MAEPSQPQTTPSAAAPPGAPAPQAGAEVEPSRALASAPATRFEVEAGLRGLQAQQADVRRELLELRATLTALTATLTTRNLLPQREFERRRARAMDAALAAQADEPVTLAEPVDKYALGPLPEVDCAALMPLCHGRCCRLTVWLSPQDLDERVLQWDYARPYRLRVHADDGYCVHSDRQTRGCGAYAVRPATCRTYDCRTDRRIWLDFARRIPAPE